MHIGEFDYELPPSAIAQEPLPERDASRLLVLRREGGERSHHAFRDLPDLLRAGDLLIVNRSRVFPARLIGRRRGGGKAEIFLLKRVDEDRWEALLRPGRRLRKGDVVEVGLELAVEIESGAFGPEARRRVRLRAGGDPAQAIDTQGHVPLPPYIKRPDRPADRERYQTVYARETGSVAAPTAGLHFTPALLQRLRDRGIETAEVILHVGPGTFRPVTVEQVEDHRVETEPYVVPAETAQAVAQARVGGGRVVAAGTTVVRTLETAARDDRTVAAGAGETELVVIPGYDFRVVDALLTNFHLPRSSLLLLVAAFAGRERVLEAYAEAVRSGYRFYSYGDAMLVM